MHSGIDDPAPGSHGNSADAATPSLDAACAFVAATLWQEREQLEHLLFTLTSQQLVLASGTTRWLHRSDALVRAAVETVAETELRRAVDTLEVTRALGLAPDVGLAEIAARSPEPWGPLLDEHRRTLQELSAEIGVATAENRRLLRAGAEAIRETLAEVGSVAAEYGFVRDRRLNSGSVLLDRQA